MEEKRRFVGDFREMYRNKWIVIYDAIWSDTLDNALEGKVYAVYDDEDDAREVRRSLKKNPEFGGTLLMKGNDGKPELGGIFVDG